MNQIDLLIQARERDLGGFSVRRILPYATHRMVGPFIFFDHMGPAELPPGQGMDVRPHPHIGLATVTYLFEGKIHHQDSLGFKQDIEPGAINWMTAGRGIVHSERTPAPERKSGTRMNGIQCWVALPEEHEETEPSFVHHPAKTLPEFEIGNCKLKLLLGSLFDRTSPVKIHSELFYLEIQMPKAAELQIPIGDRESALYVVDGEISIDQQKLNSTTMAVMKRGEDLWIRASENSRLMLLGGKPVGERVIYWNFVASSKQKLENAKKEWLKGPGPQSRLFPAIPGDDKEFIPLPIEPGNPKGTIM